MDGNARRYFTVDGPLNFGFGVFSYVCEASASAFPSSSESESYDKTLIMT